jgi:hypothetical protein
MTPFFRYVICGLKGRTAVDVVYLGIGAAFFATAWVVVWAFGRLLGEKPS